MLNDFHWTLCFAGVATRVIAKRTGKRARANDVKRFGIDDEPPQETHFLPLFPAIWICQVSLMFVISTFARKRAAWR
ncbi:hypothetical protein A464_73 [Salmonella bongori N268-08]|uniref:Uncharacterized protein n=1 Tax=Salmonella bongori N268-08 TaxID=1197719 RepID=S5MRM0_SALBN|nr:hypothetical protein A464_73 [Salmonella bongori N268-08]